MSNKGYFEIGIYHVKHYVNIGTLWRSAYQLGASGIFTIGKRYKKQNSDTYQTPEHIPLRHFLTLEDFMEQRPKGALLTGVEMGGTSLSKFVHPKKAVYLLGAEDHGLPNFVVEQCNAIVSLESIRNQSYNVAVAGSLVMYDRVFNTKAMEVK